MLKRLPSVSSLQCCCEIQNGTFFCHHEWLLDIALNFKIKNFSNRNIDKNLEMGNKCCTTALSAILYYSYRGSYYGGGGGDAILSVAVKLTCPTVIACFNEIVHYVKVFLHPFVQE